MAKYGYMVVKNRGGIPLHIVQVESMELSSYSVFNTSKDASDYIDYIRMRILENGEELEYDYDFQFAPVLTHIYKTSDKLFSRLSNRQVYVYAIK